MRCWRRWASLRGGCAGLVGGIDLLGGPVYAQMPGDATQAPEIMMSPHGGASGNICIDCSNEPVIFFD